jgi:xyloglucan-specific exo-beta-1,4-glucanase
VWATADTSSVWYSSNSGASWKASTGIPAQAQVVSDRVKAGVYYGFSSGTLYLSTNGGQTWTTEQSGLPNSGTLVILPDTQGDLWLASGSGLYHNTGSASSPTLTAVSGVSSANYLGFGKAAPASNFLTLFLYGTSNGALDLYRSTDGGTSWTQINDSAHQWGGGIGGVTGDMRTFGTVYIATGGRGIIWGTSTK